jgi:hypothetical protein
MDREPAQVEVAVFDHHDGLGTGRTNEIANEVSVTSDLLAAGGDGRLRVGRSRTDDADGDDGDDQQAASDVAGPAGADGHGGPPRVAKGDAPRLEQRRAPGQGKTA